MWLFVLVNNNLCQSINNNYAETLGITISNNQNIVIKEYEVNYSDKNLSTNVENLR